MVKKLRTPGSDATKRWFAFCMKDAQFDIYKQQVNVFAIRRLHFFCSPLLHKPNFKENISGIKLLPEF